MKQQLLILGNGFDLHCGLKSSYKDFFYNAITLLEKSGIPKLQSEVSGFWENLLFEYYKQFGDKDYNWCDIENIIKDTLYLIYFGEDSSEENSNNGLFSIAVNRISSNYTSYSHYENESKIMKLNDLKKYIFNYCYNFLNVNEFNGNFLEYLNLLSKKLLQELHNFERRFCRYIRDNITFQKDKYIVNSVNLLAKLTEFSNANYEDLDDVIEVQELSPLNLSNWCSPLNKEEKILDDDFYNLKYTNIINFNYTSLFDILGVKSPCEYSNVHGKLCNNSCLGTCNYSSVIFGIDDTLIRSENMNTDLRLFSKTYRKMLNSSTPINILPSNNTYLEIKFYGHSLSESDYSYFQSIFDYYELYSNSKVSLIFYYSKGFENHDAVYNLINEYGKTLTNKNQGKNLMHKLLLENRLHIQEVKD